MKTIERVVLDTGFLVSAALKNGSIPRQALLKAYTNCLIFMSSVTFNELREVLQRKKFYSYINADSINSFIETIYHHSLLAEQPEYQPPLEPICRDEKDRKFLDLAFHVNADAIISSDDDLLVMNPWNGIQILSPREFLNCFPNEESE